MGTEIRHKYLYALYSQSKGTGRRLHGRCDTRMGLLGRFRRKIISRACAELEKECRF